MSTFLWITLVVIYLVALVSLGLATLRKGHTVLFWVGIIFPVLWIIGALMHPQRGWPPQTPGARCRGPEPACVSIHAIGVMTGGCGRGPAARKESSHERTGLRPCGRPGGGRPRMS